MKRIGRSKLSCLRLCVRPREQELLWLTAALCTPVRSASNVGAEVPLARTAVPEFGSRKKHARRAEDRSHRDRAVLDAQAARSQAPTREEEEDAEVVCKARYGFLEKPLYMPYWKHFVGELQRFEFRWSLTPGLSGVYHLDIVEFDAEGEKVLCHLQGDGNQCLPIADVFEGLAGILQGTFLSFSVPFISRVVADGRPQYLVFEATPMISTPVSAAPAGGGGSGVPSVQEYGLFTQTAKTGYCMSMYLMEKDSPIKTPIFHEVSLQTTCHMHLISIPPFLRRTDIGIPNCDFMPSDQMTMFRFVWCFLRRECRMTPLELSALDALLPPK